MKKWVAVAAALLLIVGCIYFGSPYYAILSLRNAAIEADTDKLAARVDFPSGRDSLKPQLSATLMAKMQNDPEMRNNHFARMGAMMLPAIIDRMVDSFVTPDAIAALMRGQHPANKAKVQANSDIASRNG